MNHRPTGTPDEGASRRLRVRIRRHLAWARNQGVGRLIEEDELNPIARIPLAVGKWRWRRAHRVAPNAIPVFLVGVQRSGTNMLVRGLERSPEFEVHNENDRRAFERFRLRPLPLVRDIVVRSGHRYVLFKPLMDSHRAGEILDRLGTPSPAKAIWAYRSVDGRVRSAVAKFGSNNLIALQRIASPEGVDRLEVGAPSAETISSIRTGLSPRSLEVVGSFDYRTMSPESGAALYWYVRNEAYFEQGLHRRNDVILVSYEAFLADPEGCMRRLCRFLGFPYHARLVAEVRPRGRGDIPPLDLDPRVRGLCTDLEDRLDAAAGTQKAGSEAD